MGTMIFREAVVDFDNFPTQSYADIYDMKVVDNSGVTVKFSLSESEARELVRHLIEVFGEGEVRSWYTT